MFLKPNISIVEFLRATNCCTGNVYFLTDSGDRLNLKSELTKYLFLSLAMSDGSAHLLCGKVYCTDAGDYGKLDCFLTER